VPEILRLKKNFNKSNSSSISTYLENDGYKSIQKALGMNRHDITEEVKKSGLRGRGGAGFPTGLKWTFIPKDIDKPVYLLCNADEGEPGTFKDREIILNDPHMLIEGMLIAGFAIKSNLSYVYIRGEFVKEAEVLEKAIKEAHDKNFLGKNVFDSGFDFEIHVHRGAGAYICGEETSLISSLEGVRGLPRLKPPFPAVVGLYGCPTIVNNVETLASVPSILENGASWYREYGTEKSAGTKLFCISGAVKKPGTYELPLGFPLKDLIYDLAGGIVDGQELKAVIPGGSSTPILKAEDALKANLDYESLADVGSMLGSGAVIVIGDASCTVRNTWILARFYAHESCGQCTPCREGVPWMEKILNRIEHGKGEDGDLDMLLEIANGTMGTSICPLLEAAAMPVISAIENFRSEFEDHIKNKKCTHGVKIG